MIQHQIQHFILATNYLLLEPMVSILIFLHSKLASSIMEMMMIQHQIQHFILATNYLLLEPMVSIPIFLHSKLASSIVENINYELTFLKIFTRPIVVTVKKFQI